MFVLNLRSLKLRRGAVFARKSALLLAVVMVCSGWSAHGHASIFSEGSIVLVLKLVSKTQVQPTTGVVVSDSGLVMVSAGFITEGDEIVVMDGGTDISTYARPATLIDSDEQSGMAVISVADLKRKPILLSKFVSTADGGLHLAAFPPAEQIANGAAPLWLPVLVESVSGHDQWRVNNADSLPNVSGPILDVCGFFTGMQLASGGQSLNSANASTQIGAPMLDALKRLNISLAPASCDTSAGSERNATSRANENAATKASQQPPSVDETMPTVIDHARDAGTDDAGREQIATPSGTDKPQTDAISRPVSQAPAQAAPSVWSLVPWWLWLLIAVLLAATFFKLTRLWQLVNRSPSPPAESQLRQAPIVEPPTIELLRGAADRDTHGLAAYAIAEEQMPDINLLPEGCNAIVCIKGKLSNGSQFSRYASVEKSHIDLIIGRGEADISIESPTISRQHARLKGSMNALTISDLGSNNGSFIGTVPCLPGEIIYVGTGDEVMLGDVRFNISVKYKVERLS